jgi:hypothetical protein
VAGAIKLWDLTSESFSNPLAWFTWHWKLINNKYIYIYSSRVCNVCSLCCFYRSSKTRSVSPKSSREIECIYTRDLTRERLHQTAEYLLNCNWGKSVARFHRGAWGFTFFLEIRLVEFRCFHLLQIRLARTRFIRKIHAWHRPSCVFKCCFYVLTVLFCTPRCNCNEMVSTKHKVEQVYLEAENGLCICSVIRATFFTQVSPNKYGTTAASNITVERLSRIREALGSILDPETCYPRRNVAWFPQSVHENCVYSTRNGFFPNS